MKVWVLVALVALVSLAAADEAEDVQYLQMRRTSCVILSRIHSNQEKAVIEEVIQGLEPNDQQKYIDKIYINAVEKCEAEITQQEVQSVPSSLSSSTLKAKSSTPPPSSPSSTASTTEKLPTTSLPLRSSSKSQNSSKSSTKKIKSARRNAKPRNSRKTAELQRATR
jgi:hypothetical protein